MKFLEQASFDEVRARYVELGGLTPEKFQADADAARAERDSLAATVARLTVTEAELRVELDEAETLAKGMAEQVKRLEADNERLVAEHQTWRDHFDGKHGADLSNPLCHHCLSVHALDERDAALAEVNDQLEVMSQQRARLDEQEEFIDALGQLVCAAAFVMGQVDGQNEHNLAFALCAYCLHEDERTPEAMTAHARTCEKHPLSAALADAARCREALTSVWNQVGMPNAIAETVRAALANPSGAEWLERVKRAAWDEGSRDQFLKWKSAIAGTGDRSENVTGLLAEHDAKVLAAALAVDSLRVAQLFHETYERLAPSHGYKTREASAKPWSDVPEQNRALMTATVREVFAALASPSAPAKPSEPTCASCGGSGELLGSYAHGDANAEPCPACSGKAAKP